MTKFFYARKSTDEPDRQFLSIEAQITEYNISTEDLVLLDLN